MRKVIVGVIAGLVLGLLWSMYLTVVPQGSEVTFSTYLAMLLSPLTLINVLVGAIAGFFSLKVSRTAFIFLGAIAISIIAHLIIASRSGMYTASAVTGFINGLLISVAVTLIGRGK